MPSIDVPPGIEALAPQRAKLLGIVQAAQGDPDILGMVIKGSFALGIADEYSDLDLSFVTTDSNFDEVLARRPHLVSAPGEAVATFTGEHVGLPQLLIILYDDLVHADFTYVALSDFPHNDELPCRVVWERDGLLSDRLATAPHPSPRIDAAWLEARMWTWVWYTHTKILRGELYEALNALQLLRTWVLFPLLAVTRGQRPGGSRRAEQLVGDLREDFETTVTAPNRPATMKALEKCVELYLQLADPILEQQGIEKAERARRPVLDALRAGLDYEP